MNSPKAKFLDVPLRMTRESLASFSSDLLAARESDVVKVIVLKGRQQQDGQAVFSMGLDLERILSQGDCSMALVHDVVETLYAFPKPVVSAVKGDVIAGGMIWPALSDYVIVTPDVHFSLPEASFGVTPYVVMTCLAERMSKQAVRYLCITSEKINAQSALKVNLVDEIIASQAMEDRLKELIKHHSRAEPMALRNIKRFHRSDIAQIEALRKSCELLDQQLRDEDIRFNIQNYVDALLMLEMGHA